ncbi:MAG: putative N-acetylglucosaminyl phosphatidylinositol deacetylase, partial [Acidimicrobiales bacterium]|nr:putative N-acetylglucosaminyl phosphatidylinositol deacetylase [Acidimicrobiales bacterium]
MTNATNTNGRARRDEAQRRSGSTRWTARLIGIAVLASAALVVAPSAIVPTQPALAASTNIAPSATATASSQNTSTGQTAAKAIDGVIDGWPGDYTREWATNGGKANSWIKLTWPTAVNLDKVVLYDRPNTNDQITKATLLFSNGTTVAVGALVNSGTATTITFTARSVTSVRLTVNSVKSSTVNVGLAELQAWGTVDTPPTTSSAPSTTAAPTTAAPTTAAPTTAAPTTAAPTTAAPTTAAPTTAAPTTAAPTTAAP